ncbi:hypothetical protein FOZ62_027844, partial [Perkinsus olseni]
AHQLRPVPVDTVRYDTHPKKVLRSMSFEVSDKKISDIDREAETEFLGLTIVNYDQGKFYTISEKKDAKLKEVLKKGYDSTDITYQTLLSCIGSIPKYNVYSPWLSTLSNKIQSVASREKSQVQADWSDVVSPPLRNLIRRWIVFAIDNKPLKVPLYIYPDSKLTVFVDASKWAIGFIVYQRHGDSDVVLHRENILFPPNRTSLNISFKEMIALRYAISWVLKLQTLSERSFHVTVYSDSQLCCSIIRNNRVRNLPSASRNHLELLRREYSVVREMLTSITTFTIFHIDGPNNPADALTRHPFLDYITSSFPDSDVLGELQSPMITDETLAASPRPISEETMTSSTRRQDQPQGQTNTINAIFTMTDMPKTVSLDDIETAQQNDPLLPQDDEHYTVINGIVHRKTQHGYPLPYIPPGLRVRLLNLHHDTINGAHFAADRMYEALKRVCYWTNMMDDCTWWCDSCGTCQRNKPQRARPQPLRSRVGSYPHELVFADYLSLDHIPILVLTDAFSKYLTTYVVSTTKYSQPDAATTVKHLLQYITSYGPFTYLFTDNGSHSKNQSVYQLLNAFNIQMTNSARCRRHHMRPIVMGKNFADKYSNWADYLPLLTLAYNNSVHSTTGEAPSHVFFGRSPSPYMITTSVPPVRFESASQEQLLRKADNRQRYHQHQQHAATQSVDLGDRVWWWNPHGPTEPSRKSKLVAKWLGPYIVRRFYPGTRLMVYISGEGSNKEIVTHINNIRPVNHPVRGLLRDESIMAHDDLTHLQTVGKEALTTSLPSNFGFDILLDDEDDDDDQEMNRVDEDDHHFEENGDRRRENSPER